MIAIRPPIISYLFCLHEKLHKSEATYPKLVMTRRILNFQMSPFISLELTFNFLVISQGCQQFSTLNMCALFHIL